MTTYHPLYIQFFQYYHQGEYWEAHEVLEELWQQDRSNDFYHGLIQVAAIMHQLDRGKVLGARKLSQSAIGYLTSYGPKYDGVFVAEVLGWLRFCLQRLPEKVKTLELDEMHKLGIPICQLPKLK
jgi:predicted metal-dependent hydrolase